jgi:hypothetical protein
VRNPNIPDTLNILTDLLGGITNTGGDLLDIGGSGGIVLF